MIAVSPSIQPNSAETDSPIGPVTGNRSRSAPAGSTTSSRPLPPSATGHSSTRAPGTARRTPVAIASATCRGPSVPLKAAGATRMMGATDGKIRGNEKPPEFPQGVIACRTPCALEPDVS